MAWTTPRTWTNNEALNDTIFNQHVRDNLQFLYDRFGGGNVTLAAGSAVTLTVPATGTAALRSGTPATGRVASWASGNAVGDAGFAVSDVARLSQFPAMSVRKTSTQTGMAASAFTKITWDVADSGTFDLANERWLPGVSGEYLFTGSLVLNSPVEDASRYIVSVFKNGVRHRDYQYVSSGTGFQSAPILFPLIVLSASDYVELFLYPLTINATGIYGGATETSWSGVRVA